MTTARQAAPVQQPRDDFFRICGVAAALIMAVVLMARAPEGRPVDAALAAAPDATAAAASLLIASMESRPLVETILRGEGQAYGF